MPSTFIEFQDHGQDFLVWTLDETGVVTESWPFQTDIWRGLKVTNLASLRRKQHVEYDWHGRTGAVKYPVKQLGALAEVEVEVRLDHSGFVTNTIRGARASCTYSEQVAVDRLAEKLFPGYFTASERLDGQQSKWRIRPLGSTR